MRARSGTGKTAAFGVPAVLTATNGGSSSSNSSVSAPRALILAPTREVALQAADVITSLLSRFPMSSTSQIPSVAAFVGGLPLSADVARCRRPLAVVAATPGRARALASFFPSSSSSPSSSASSVPALDLSAVSLLVLDEADALLSSPLASDVRFLASACGCPGGGGFGGGQNRSREGQPGRKKPPPPQVLAFSATLDADAEERASRLMGSGAPRRVDASPLKGPALEGVTHYYLPILAAERLKKESSSSRRLFPTQRQRDAAVVTALSSAPFCQAAVFVSSRAHASSLAVALRNAGFPAVELSGALPQPARMEAVAALRSFSARVAVATDLGARGVDLERVNLVVNADGLPREWRRGGGGGRGSGGRKEESNNDPDDDDDGEETGETVPSPSPSSSPLPEGAATLAHRAGRAGRFGGRGACVTLVSTDDDDEGDGGDGGDDAELPRLRRALAALGAPASAPERLPSSLPAAAYRYSPPTLEERARHAEMVALREEAEGERRRREREEEEEEEEEEERVEEEAPEKKENDVVGGVGGVGGKPPSSVLRYSSEELRAMRESSSPPLLAPLPAALARAAANAAAAAARPKFAPKTPPAAAATAKAKARSSVPPPATPPPPPPPQRATGNEFDLDDDALEAAIRAVHAAAAAEEQESEEEEEEKEEEAEEGKESEGAAAMAAAAFPQPPPPPPPARPSALLPCPVPCPTCSVMVPPECCAESSAPVGASRMNQAAFRAEPLVAVPASLLRRYYELEWEAWSARQEQWQQAAAWHSWWAASASASSAAAAAAAPGQEQQ